MMLGCHGDGLLGGSSPVGGGGLSLGPVGGGLGGGALGADIKSLYAVAAVKLYNSGLDALDGLVKHEHGVPAHGHGGALGGPSAASSSSSQQLHRSHYYGYDPGMLAGLHHHHQQQHAAH
ncbi:Phosphatase and actin regulator 1 [Frankliniella fusca]|uniref:Phosphatase and actin regulator 1 n=1 Tax=Frankliniella fusca TaxID=407009 RepID=A0AAE1GSK6_9NEOP|nr:Phosphatase and actin regulator 1 [Frankliniella fusca]